VFLEIALYAIELSLKFFKVVDKVLQDKSFFGELSWPGEFFDEPDSGDDIYKSYDL